ncbi:MAG TPA: lectin-like protein, partial [bacterium]|nr:lectin-like protein [bacterium]
TWEWNGTVWKRLSNADETWAYPAAKTDYAVGYDESRGVTILHGGDLNANVLGETWEWNGYGWKKLSTATTVYRAGHTLVYDTNSQKLLMFGGIDNGAPTVHRNEVYEWSGTNWVLRPVLVGTAPSGRVYHSAAYDSVRNRMVIFGGRNSSGTILRQLYEWDNATQTWVYRNNSGPEPRINAGMVYDPVKQRTIVFGGMNYNVSPETYGDTWEYNNSTNGWSNVVANPWTWGDNYPGPGCPSDESWCWKNSSATESPMPRWGHIMVYDPAMRRTIVSGGMTFEDWSEGIYFTAGDTWIYDSATVSWRELEVINKNAFGDRTNIYLHKGFYDTNKNEIVSWSGVKGMQSDQVAYFNTNILRTGASETPSQMFTVSLDAAGLTEEYAWKDISSINLKVYAGATVYSGTSCAEVNGVILYGWADDRWLLLDQSPAPRSSVTELTFSINKPEMISKMLNGESSELYFKIETKGKAGCGNNDEPLLAVDYAEISVDIKEDSIKERYYVSTSSATWAEARADCISRGMDLAVISSQKEADLIESIITTTHYWIGLYEPSVEGEWEWVNGLKAWSGGTDGAGKTWTKWAVDSNNGMYKPNDTANLNCAIFYNYLSRIFWDWTCGSTTRYICEKRDYSYSGASGSKFTNQTACNNMGGDLVSVNSELEEDAIWPHVVQATNYQYIGLTNMSSSDNIYSWNDGDVCWDGNSGTTGTAYGYTNWGTSQPDSTSTDCVAYLYTMDKWYDYSCYYSNWSGICEF